MAPVNTDIDTVEQNIQDVIQSLFQLMVQVSTYDSAGKPSKDVLGNEIHRLSSALQAVHSLALQLPQDNPAAAAPSAPRLPLPIVEYVEGGRNPDIYTREFVELVHRMNQIVCGKMRAFRSFRDVLAGELAAANPEMADDAKRVVDATGGPFVSAQDRSGETNVAAVSTPAATGGLGRGEGGGATPAAMAVNTTGGGF